MKKRLIKVIAFILVLLIGFTTIPTNIAYGADDIAENESGVDDNVINEPQAESDEKGEGVAPEQQEVQDEESASEQGQATEPATGAVSQSIETTADGSEENQSIDSDILKYVYIESPYLESPNEQNIVVSWGEGTENIQNMQLLIDGPDGATREWALVSQTENAYLFTGNFESADKGVYHVKGIRYLQDGTEYTYEFSQFDVAAFFGVDEEYTGGEQSEHTELEPQIAEEADDTIVQTIEGQSEDVIVDAVEEILDTAGVETSTAALSNSPLIRSGSAGLVIVLDPGHDATHAGASGYGVKEHLANLAIAKACKAALEKYAGVTVYLTRETDACPYPGTGNIDDIYKRVDWAKSKGADVFISFHLNSSTETSASGAEVYYSPQEGTSVSGGPLANSIQSQLVALGLGNRGAIADNEYAVCNASKKSGFPGLIIEHAFVSNASDASKYLNAAGLQKLGAADAKGIASYYNLQPKGSGKWVQDSGGWRYQFSDGTYVKSSWYDIEGKRYYFGSNGYRVTGLVYVGADRYYFDSSGVMLRGWLTYEGSRYYFGSNGIMVKGWVYIGSDRYYFSDSTGKMITGLVYVGADRYYFNAQGIMQKKCWITLDGAKYFLSSNGIVVTGWAYVGADRFYFSTSTGKMVTGLVYIGADRYYFDQYGVMQKSTWYINGNSRYYLTSNGIAITGWAYIGAGRYYFGKDGVMQTGWLNDGGAKYYLATNGIMVTGWAYVGADRYYFSASTGKMITGLVYIGASRYYFNSDGIMQVKTWAAEGGSRYYLGSNGIVVTGWAYVGADRYYFSTSSGKMITGWAYVGAGQYYFGTDGIMRTGWVEISKIWYLFNQDGTYTGKTSPNGPVDPPIQAGYSIMGTTSVTVNQMAQYYKSFGRAYPSYYSQSTDAKTIEQLCQIYYEEAAAEGIRAEVAFAQAMKETGWLQFGGVVNIEQNNFAGMGAVDSGGSGASFESVRIGVRAQIQHLKAYGSTAPLNNVCVDPRFHLVTRGTAIYVEHLGIKENPLGVGWASAVNYGYDIVKMINVIKGM